MRILFRLRCGILDWSGGEPRTDEFSDPSKKTDVREKQHRDKNQCVSTTLLPGSHLPTQNKSDAEDYSGDDSGTMHAVLLTGLGYITDQIIKVLACRFLAG